MYVHWSIVWFFSWAALAGLYSFQFWTSQQIFKKLLAIVLLSIALTMYPPAALFFFAAITVINVLNQSKSSKFLSEAIQALVLLTLSILVSAFSVIITMQMAGISPNERVRLVQLSEIPRKIIWIFTRPLIVGLRPFTIDSPTPKLAVLTSLPVIFILFLGILRQSRQLGEFFLHRVFAIVFPLLLTLIPIAVTSDNQIEFRILPGYCWGVAAIGSFFLLTEFDKWLVTYGFKGRALKVGSLLAASILSLVAIISVNSHYDQFFGGPYNKKTAFLNAKIASCLSVRDVKTILILPPKEPFPIFQRLGVFSMSTDLASSWVPKPNVELLLRERKAALAVSYLDVRPVVLKIAETECVIDLEEFRALLK
jgi:hypothetical protein